MKRFTETSKWMDPWYRKLSSTGKLIWQYLCDTCDLIGLAEFDIELATIDLGSKVKPDWHMEFGDRIQLVGNSKVFITKFIDFQYGELSPDCPPHRKIIKALNDRGLVRDSLGYRYPTNTLSVGFQYPIGKEEEKDSTGKGKEEGVVGGEPAIPLGIPKLPPSQTPAELAAVAAEIYEAYPRKTARETAIKSILKAVKEFGGDFVLERTKLYAKAREGQDPQYTPHPATWFNQQRFNDDPAVWLPHQSQPKKRLNYQP